MELFIDSRQLHSNQLTADIKAIIAPVLEMEANCKDLTAPPTREQFEELIKVQNEILKTTKGFHVPPVDPNASLKKAIDILKLIAVLASLLC